MKRDAIPQLEIDRLVDEHYAYEAADDAPFGCPARGGDVSFRLLHIFEFKDGRISRENAWMDVADIQRQLGSPPESPC